MKPKRRANGKKASTAREQSGGVVHRVNRHAGNGSAPESAEVLPERVPIGEAMRQAVEALGEVVIDDTLAPAHLRELSEHYEQVVRMQAAFDARSAEAKTAKKSLESATNLLLEKVRAFTHPVALPLFDAKEREAETQAMLDAAPAAAGKDAAAGA